jgi:hypothetical protein
VASSQRGTSGNVSDVVEGSDSGYGYDIFIADQPGADLNLIAMCRAFATPAA